MNAFSEPSLTTTPANTPTDVLPAAVQRVAHALKACGTAAPPVPLMLQVDARTAQEAADALNVALGQIAKSVIFRRLADNAPVLVMTAGDQRVDVDKVSALVGAVGKADAQFVKDRTGFVIGGVAPVGHLEPPITLLDMSLRRFTCLWAAAGHPRALVEMSPEILEALTGAPWAEVTLERASA